MWAVALGRSSPDVPPLSAALSLVLFCGPFWTVPAGEAIFPQNALSLYSRVVSDSRVRSGYLNLVVVPLDIARMECHVARRQIEPNPEHEVQGVDAYCSIFCYWGCQRARQSRLRYLPEIVSSNPVPVLWIFDRVWACALKIAQTYVRIESLRCSTPACVKPSDLSRTNVVQAPEISRLWRMASFGWKNGPCATYACLYAPDVVKNVLQDPSTWHPWSNFCRQSCSGGTANSAQSRL